MKKLICYNNKNSKALQIHDLGCQYPCSDHELRFVLVLGVDNFFIQLNNKLELKNTATESDPSLMRFPIIKQNRLFSLVTPLEKN
ncbi:hypothetical protein BpHYR1_013334 [Brachionus plicatilis]|uniref:Uncharacterized protein n=1 Tax=Brachionus plicatilis TaxID=10195 RepID=A0A3M7QXG1_BRAPC|nr:hypothetical protein BpHYR1_013334 [Brachionus plicatilis]